MHGRRKKIEALWKLLAESFETQVAGGMLSASGGNQQKHQVKFRLQRAIARLMHVDLISADDTKPIRADIMLCETLDWVGDKTAKQTYDILDELEEN